MFAYFNLLFCSLEEEMNYNNITIFFISFLADIIDVKTGILLTKAMRNCIFSKNRNIKKYHPDRPIYVTKPAEKS